MRSRFTLMLVIAVFASGLGSAPPSAAREGLLTDPDGYVAWSKR